MTEPELVEAQKTLEKCLDPIKKVRTLINAALRDANKTTIDPNSGVFDKAKHGIMNVWGKFAGTTNKSSIKNEMAQTLETLRTDITAMHKAIKDMQKIVAPKKMPTKKTGVDAVIDATATQIRYPKKETSRQHSAAARGHAGTLAVAGKQKQKPKKLQNTSPSQYFPLAKAVPNTIAIMSDAIYANDCRTLGLPERPGKTILDDLDALYCINVKLHIPNRALSNVDLKKATLRTAVLNKCCDIDNWDGQFSVNTYLPSAVTQLGTNPHFRQYLIGYLYFVAWLARSLRLTSTQPLTRGPEPPNEKVELKGVVVKTVYSEEQQRRFELSKSGHPKTETPTHAFMEDCKDVEANLRDYVTGTRSNRFRSVFENNHDPDESTDGLAHDPDAALRLYKWPAGGTLTPASIFFDLFRGDTIENTIKSKFNLTEQQQQHSAVLAQLKSNIQANVTTEPRNKLRATETFFHRLGTWDACNAVVNAV